MLPNLLFCHSCKHSNNTGDDNGDDDDDDDDDDYENDDLRCEADGLR